MGNLTVKNWLSNFGLGYEFPKPPGSTAAGRTGYSHLSGSFQNQPRLLKYCLHMVKWNMNWFYFYNDPLLLSGNVLVQLWFCPCEPETSLIPTINHPAVVFPCIFSIFVGCIWNTRVIAPLWSYPCCLLVLATSSYVCKDVSNSASGIYSLLCSMHLALAAQVNWTEHFSFKVQWFLEWELIWGLPVATSPAERWWPPMTCHPEQDDGCVLHGEHNIY